MENNMESSIFRFAHKAIQLHQRCKHALKAQQDVQQMPIVPSSKLV